MSHFRVVRTYFILGFKEYFLSRKTALIQLIVLPTLAPILLLAFVLLMTSIMMSNVQIKGANSNVGEITSVIGVVLPAGESAKFEAIRQGLSSLPIKNRAQLYKDVSSADEALLSEKAHAVLVFASLRPVTIQIRSNSQKQTIYHHILESLDSYELAKALLPLRERLVMEHMDIDSVDVQGIFEAGELSKVQIGNNQTPLFALAIVGLFWVCTVMYPVSLAKMNIFYNNDIASDDLSHCFSLRLPSFYYVISRLAGAYAVYLPASIIMFGILVSYLALIKSFMLSSLAAPLYESEDIRIVIEQYLSWSDILFTSKVVILPMLIATLGLPMLASNLLIYFYSKDEKSAVTYSSYLDTISYAFPAFAAFVSATTPDLFGVLPFLQQYYLLRAVVVDSLTFDFIWMYVTSMFCFITFLISLGAYRAYHPQRWIRG